jgi:glutamate synthase domain-containing protein 1/glutamate synthase domain-containing protein 3
MNRQVEHVLAARGRLIEGLPAPREDEGVEEGGCGVVGFAASVPVKGRNVFQACMQMHNRGNGKGGGIAAAGLVPDQLGVSAATLRESYLIQVALLDPRAEGQVEESFLTPDLEIAYKARVAHLEDPAEAGLDVRPPEVTRYFARVKPASLRRFAEANHLEELPPRALEDEFIYQNSFKLNQRFYASLGEKQAFVLSHARDLLIFKIVGYAEQVVKYYRMDDFQAHVWIAHQRYPTKGRVWHPAGAHPFIGMNEALVHNGDFANYFSITEHLRQHNVVPQFLTDTEVSVLTYDLLHRTFGYPLEYVIEALAPTTELDFDRLPAEKKKVYRAIQSMHMHGSPDGPWFFIIASSAPDEGRYQLVGITDTAMLRPQVFALQEGDASIGLVASEKQAIDATLQALSAEDARFRPVADVYWNARGGSHKDGGAFVFTVDAAGAHAALTCADKFGNAIASPPGDWRWKRSAEPSAPDQGDALSAGIARAAAAGETSAISAEIASSVATWGFANVQWVLDRILAEAAADRSRFDWALGVLLTLNDRHYYCGALKRSVVVQQVREAIDALLDSVPSVSANGSSSARRVDWGTRDTLRPPGSGEKTLVICARGFQAEGEDCDSRVLVRGYKLGWRSFIVYALSGQRFTGCGLGVDSSGVRIDVLGSSGDYLASGIDGMEIHVHDNGQDQLGQIMKQGTLVVHGDVGQAFMYGAKGGDVYVLGNSAGRPLINGVGRPRVVINGTCLDFLAESFMAGDPLNGGGFVVLNGVRFNGRGQVEDLETPYPGANLFSMASGGAIYVRDPGGKLVADQLNGGEFVEMTEADWDLIHPYLLANERHFGISVEGDLLRVGAARKRPQEVYRKVQPKNGKGAAAAKPGA